MKICLKAKGKCYQQEKDAKRPTLLSFFSRQCPAPVPSSIASSTLVHSHKLAPRKVAGPRVPSKPVVVPSVIISPTPPTANFLEKLLDLIKHILDTVPEATDYDRLAIFACHPGDFDIPDLSVDDLWEEVLNIWKKRFKTMKQSKKVRLPPLIISEEHRANIPGG